MKYFFIYILAICFGYLLGSIPFGYIIARKKLGIDIREHGSGNIGATNIWRVAGKKYGAICFALDFLKGFVPVIILIYFYFERAGIAAGASAVIGHFFPVWIKGKGGKGIATGAGIFSALAPIPFLYALLTFAVVGPLATRTISAGAITGAVVLAFMCWLSPSKDIAVVSTILAGMIIYKHRSNIKRLYDGTESKIWGGLEQ